MTDAYAGPSLSDWIAGFRPDPGFRCHFVNVAPAPDRWGFVDRVLDEGHLVMLRRGRARYRLADRTITMTAGDVVVIGPKVSHGVQGDVEERPAILTCRFGYQGRMGALPPLTWVGRPRNRREVIRLWEAMLDHHLTDGVLDQLQADALLTRLLLCLAQDESGRLVDERIDPVVQFLRQHPAERIDVSELTAMAGLSRKHFSRRFRQRTGSSPVAFHIGVRCDRARELLLETDLSIAAIATELGYPDAFSFSKQFTRQVGLPPSRFRQGVGQ